MRTLWNMMSFIAVVNMLALIGLGGWLWKTGRLSPERVRETKMLYALSVDEAEAVLRADEETEQAAARDAVRTWEKANPPLPSNAQIQEIALVRAQQAQAERRLDDQSDQLFDRLEDRIRLITEREKALTEREAAWETMVAGQIEDNRQTQFAKTVKLYEALPGKQAKQMLMNLVAQDQLDQAVRYLDAMNTRAAAKIIRELKSDEENVLATELLEALRALEPNGAPKETSGNDNAATTPGANDPALGPAGTP